MSGLHAKEAHTQVVFREVNERIEQIAETFGLNEQGSFICECGNPDCTQPIELTRAEYEDVRAHGNRFVIAPDHENPETESIVGQNARHTIVETYAGASSRIALEEDPRSQQHLRLKDRGNSA